MQNKKCFLCLTTPKDNCKRCAIVNDNMLTAKQKVKLLTKRKRTDFKELFSKKHSDLKKLQNK